MVGPLVVGQIVTAVGLAAAFVLFAYMSIISSNPDIPRWKSLRFGLSVVTVIWLIPEVASALLPGWLPYPTTLSGDYGGEGEIELGIGVLVHAIAMAVFSVYIILKTRAFLKG